MYRLGQRSPVKNKELAELIIAANEKFYHYFMPMSGIYRAIYLISIYPCYMGTSIGDIVTVTDVLLHCD